MKKLIVQLVILLSVSIYCVYAITGHGEQCVRGDSDDCDPDLFLICNTQSVVGYVCGCDDAVALENADNEGICEPYRTELEEDCEGSYSADLCQEIPGNKIMTFQRIVF